jgi:hypothetical protein
MHPGAGGPAIILKNAGTDATMGFVKAKHSPKAMALRDGPPHPAPAPPLVHLAHAPPGVGPNAVYGARVLARRACFAGGGSLADTGELSWRRRAGWLAGCQGC